MLFHIRGTCCPQTPPINPAVSWNWSSFGKQLTEAGGIVQQCWRSPGSWKHFCHMHHVLITSPCLPAALVCSGYQGGKMKNLDSPKSRKHRLENILSQSELKGAQYLRCPHSVCTQLLHCGP